MQPIHTARISCICLNFAASVHFAVPKTIFLGSHSSTFSYSKIEVAREKIGIHWLLSKRFRFDNNDDVIFVCPLNNIQRFGEQASLTSATATETPKFNGTLKQKEIASRGGEKMSQTLSNQPINVQKPFYFILVWRLRIFRNWRIASIFRSDP